MNIVATRREFLTTVAAGSVGSLWAGRFSPAAAAPTNIVAGSFAGVWQDGLKASVIPCYKAKNGGDVALVFGTPSDFAQKIMATRDRPHDRRRDRHRRRRVPERPARHHREAGAGQAPQPRRASCPSSRSPTRAGPSGSTAGATASPSTPTRSSSRPRLAGVHRARGQGRIRARRPLSASDGDRWARHHLADQPRARRKPQQPGAGHQALAGDEALHHEVLHEQRRAGHGPDQRRGGRGRVDRRANVRRAGRRAEAHPVLSARARAARC